ncbi:hypothetical protein GALL_528160 [mine drainage metagenome]|uniref:Uncharacterized protein n=1 Tax=mine drainage metagenome TaxID=410659 RepID=A0A1J5PCS4_9ZZZZ
MGRKVEVGQVESGNVCGTWSLPEQHGQQVVGLLQLVAQWGQSRAGLLDLGLQGQHVGAGGGAQLEALARNIELALLRLQDGFGGLDLRTELRLAERSGGDIPRQCHAGAVELVALIVDLRGQRFERAAVAAEQVEVVVDRDTGVIQVVDIARVAALAETGRIGLVAAGAELAVHRGIEGRAGLRRIGLLGLAQTGLCRGQRRAVLQALGDQRVQFGRAELLPPVCRYCGGGE